MLDNTSTKTAADILVPDIKDFLKSGVQFGHETTRWNPKMKSYIFASKNNIHIIDLQQSIPMLVKAANFLTEAAKRGPILLVGTKRQARDIIKQYAEESGSYYVTYRWLGGLLTNFKMIKHSLQKLASIEDEFEKGVSNRTKFEVNKMKKEWERMDRIYSGIKTMEKYPEAIVIVDCHYEKGAVEEAKAAGIPIVAMVDTNCDPDDINYVIPANDDAIKSINLIMGVLSAAIRKGNPGKWVKHVNKDFSNYEIPVIKEHKEELVKEDEVAMSEPKQENKPRKHEQTKGIMEMVKEQAQKAAEPEPVAPKKESKPAVTKAVKKVTKTVKPVKPAAKKAVKKIVKKVKK